MSRKRLMVLSPHTDDGELGAGGTMARLAEEGWEIHYIAFSMGSAIDREVLAACRHLGVEQGHIVLYGYPSRYFHERRQKVLQDMINLRDKLQPALVLAPSLRDDCHQDHQVVAAEARRAFKDVGLLGYELPWNNRSFSTDLFYQLQPRHVQAKWRAVACYESQSQRPYWGRPFIYALAHVRGVQVGTQYAEAFEVVRWVQ